MDTAGLVVTWLASRATSWHALCLTAVPVTHVACLLGYSVSSVKDGLLFPFRGGGRHIVFQILAWGLWVLSVLALVPNYKAFLSKPALLGSPLPVIPLTHVDVISGAAAASSFMGELFMLKAMLVYEGDKDHKAYVRKIVTPSVAVAAVLVMGLLLALTGCLLLMTIEYMPDIPSRMLYCCLALVCVLIGGSCTHGLGGHLRFKQQYSSKPPPPAKRNGSSSSSSSGSKPRMSRHPSEAVDIGEVPVVVDGTTWQFWQPFAGGSVFVATQAIGWSFFAATIVYIVVLAKHLMAGITFSVRWWVLGAGVLMILTQMTLGVSLLTYQGRRKTLRTAKKLITHPRKTVSDFQHQLNLVLPVLLMYTPIHVFFVVWGFTFALLPVHWAMTLWAAFLIPYYAITMQGNPQHTGRRRWHWLMDWFTNNVEAALTYWFGSVEVIRDFTQEADPNNKYIFGFHPHGLYPTGAGFLPLMPSFQKLMRGIRPVTLTASVLYYPPGVRDIAMWSGFRQVSKGTFVKALSEQKSAIMCPGGQAELIYTYKAFLKEREVVIYAGHKGFVRMAIEQQACLVPVLALGEVLQLANGVNWPSLQKYTYKRLGFPVPYMMMGRWGVSPLPSAVPLKYIIGEPLQPPPLEPGASPSLEAIDALHHQFYSSLEALYHKYHHLHPIFKDASIRVIYQHLE